MRDPNRIPAILDRLRKCWQTYPDLRLGQLISNATPPRFERKTIDGLAFHDPFYVEDEELIQSMEDTIRRSV